MAKTLFPSMALILFLLSGCNESSGGQQDYEQSKNMILDVLRSDDGKLALAEILEADSLKEQLLLKDDLIADTLQKVIKSADAKQFWTSAFNDPAFASSYAEALKDEHKDLLTDLMNDPAYRAMMVDILQDEQMMKAFKDTIKSNEVRKVLKDTVEETLKSPLVQEKLLKAVKNAGQDSSAKEEQEGSSQTDTSSSPSGGEEGDSKTSSESSSDKQQSTEDGG
ncbi:MAG: spore germination lipoprotein GerD [Bacillus sp. (in: firmicutes)]